MAACKLTWFAPPTTQICEQKTFYSSYVLRPFLPCFREEKLQQKGELVCAQLPPLDS